MESYQTKRLIRLRKERKRRIRWLLADIFAGALLVFIIGAVLVSIAAMLT